MYKNQRMCEIGDFYAKMAYFLYKNQRIYEIGDFSSEILVRKLLKKGKKDPKSALYGTFLPPKKCVVWHFFTNF